MNEKRKLKLSDKDFRELLLEKYVDECGKKVSDRNILADNDFQELTGLYQIDKITGFKKPCSVGNISYWKRKLGINEYEVYMYHKNITKRVTEDYEIWTNKTDKNITKRRRKHRGKGEKVNKLNQYSTHVEKEIIIKDCGFPLNFINYEIERVRELALDLWKECGIDGVNQLRLIQNKVLTREKKSLFKSKK